MYRCPVGVTSLYTVLNYRALNRLSDQEKQLFWDFKFHAILSTIFSQPSSDNQELAEDCR